MGPGEWIGVSVTVGIPALGFVVWLVRLEGRVNTQDVKHGQIRDDLNYIRERIDRALSGKH